MPLIGSSLPVNVMVVGRTGAGKSSLLNMIAGRRMFSAKSGKPMTKGVKRKKIRISGQSFVLFDTEGFENTKTSDWETLICNSFTGRDDFASPSEWFHVVLYCIQATGSRVEDFDERALKILMEQQNQILVVMTKCDGGTDKEIDSIKAEINSIGKKCDSKVTIPIIETYSTSILGSSSGRDVLIGKIIDQWHSSLVQRYPSHVFGWAIDRIDNWYRDIYKWVWSQNLRFYGRHKEHVAREAQEEMETFLSGVNKELQVRSKKAYRQISRVSHSFRKGLTIGKTHVSSSVHLEEVIYETKLFNDSILSNVLTAIGVGAFFPILTLIAFASSGKSDKKEICKAIRTRLDKIEATLRHAQDDLQLNLANAYERMPENTSP